MPALLLAAALIGAAPDPAPAPTPPSALSISPCVDEQARQFDFLIGDWIVTKTGDTDPLAKVTVTRVADGCGLLETLTPLKGISAEALFAYDADATLWRMNQVSGDGQVLEVQGGLQDGQMVLEGDETGTARRQLARITFASNGETIHESAERSPDGRVWNDWFARDYRRPAAPAAEPAKVAPADPPATPRP
jgi:hypothetical protein